MPSENSCISCLEQIRPGAKKCPHCLQVQSAFHSLSVNSKVHWGAAVLVFGMVAYAVYAILTTDRYVKPDPPILSISGLHSIETMAGPYVTCFGDIRNPNKRQLKNIVLQANFFNSSGKRIDIIFHELEIPLGGGEELGFRIRDGASSAASDYENCGIEVVEYW